MTRHWRQHNDNTNIQISNKINIRRTNLHIYIYIYITIQIPAHTGTQYAHSHTRLILMAGWELLAKLAYCCPLVIELASDDSGGRSTVGSVTLGVLSVAKCKPLVSVYVGRGRPCRSFCRRHYQHRHQISCQALLFSYPCHPQTSPTFHFLINTFSSCFSFPFWLFLCR